MKTTGTPSLAQGLLEAAKHDRPTEAQRSRIWEQVSLVPHLVVVAPVASEVARTSIAPAAKVVSAGLSAGKMLVAGAVAGSALTIGAVTMGLFLMRAPLSERVATRDVSPRAETIHVAGTAAKAAEQAPAPALAEAPSPLPAVSRDVAQSAAVAAAPVAPAAPRGDAVHASRAPTLGSSDDALLHEAALVSQARKAIVDRRPADALDALDAAARDPSHSLEPEELSLRVRALRLLGRDAEATRVVETLKARYPGNLLVGK